MRPSRESNLSSIELTNDIPAAASGNTEAGVTHLSVLSIVISLIEKGKRTTRHQIVP